jgi:hypothetical protein
MQVSTVHTAGEITSPTVFETLGPGMTEYVHIILSGYSSRIFEIKRVPIPAPVGS